MTKNPEVLELLDNWSDREIKVRIMELRKALGLRKEWENLSRPEKDEAWQNAE